MAKTKRARAERTPFAYHEPTGEKFVQVAAIMSPLIPFIDGIAVVTFPGDKKTYLKLADAIAWVEKEMQHHSREKYEVILAVLRKYEAQDVPAEA